MKLRFSILMALTALYTQAAEHNRELAAGRDYYAAAEFRNAAGRFQVVCNTNNDAEACYWAGLSYERLADVSIPFGCRTDAKAHEYLLKAVKLAPGLSVYRDELFEFLLNTADCSRTALREAAAILSEMPESDPGYNQMCRRLEEERHYHGSAGARLAGLSLLVPRATYNMAALPAAGLRSRAAARRCCHGRGVAQENSPVMSMRTSPPSAAE